jgi:hypothetical protein
MVRLTTTALIAASLLGIFVVHATARGRSFPNEVTGTIRMYDRANHVFVIQVDEPAGALTIAVGRDCRFIQNGMLTGEQMLKKGARLKVSYFSTIFTGKIAVKIELNPTPQSKNWRPIRSRHRAFSNRLVWRRPAHAKPHNAHDPHYVRKFNEWL